MPGSKENRFPELAWLVDPHLRIIASGGSALDLIGSHPNRFAGLTIDKVLGEDHESVKHHRAAVQTGETQRYRIRYGGELWAARLVPLSNGNGDVSLIVGVAVSCAALRGGESIKVAASILGYSVEALRKRIQRGQIQASKVDGEWRIPPEEMRRLIHGIDDMTRGAS